VLVCVFSAVELYVFGHLSAQLTVYIMTVRWSSFTDLGQSSPHIIITSVHLTDPVVVIPFQSNKNW